MGLMTGGLSTEISGPEIDADTIQQLGFFENSTMAPAILTSIPTVTNGTAYASGDSIGGLISWSYDTQLLSPNRRVRQLLVWDGSNQSANIDILFWDGVPPNSTFTNDAAPSISNNDYTYLRGSVSLTAYTVLTPATNVVAQASLLALLDIMPITSGVLAITPISRGTPTYTATNALRIQVILG